MVKQLAAERGRPDPPFLAEDLARLQGVKRIERIELGDTAALLLGEQDGYVIKVNMKHSFYRQNFSCAHEIGHTLLHQFEHQQSNGSIDFRIPCLSIRQRDKERLCDMAAAELLMPRDVLEQHLSRLGTSVLAIEQLSRVFMVSKPAVAVRIAEVSQEPCIAIKWSHWQRQRSSGFVLVWLLGSGRQAHDGGYYIRERTSVRDPSALLKAYRCDEVVKSFRSFAFGGVKKRCHMESKGFGAGNMRYVVSLVFPER
jgi:Zn-dependent peptidase ImmA (M78 family)